MDWGWGFHLGLGFYWDWALGFYWDWALHGITGIGVDVGVGLGRAMAWVFHCSIFERGSMLVVLIGESLFSLQWNPHNV